MGKQKRLPDLANDQRCTRNGKNWRCHLPRLPNKSYCHKHYICNLSRSKSKSRILQALNPANASSSREIWAFYHKSNGHPNFYARVDNILPEKSAVEVNPLIPSNPSDTDVGCGLFRVSDCGITIEMGQVSHRAWFDMEADDLYKIFPRNGEVWVVDIYDLVEIVSSFDDEEGASGLVLVAVVGQQGFQRKLHDGCEMIRRFRMEEVGMFRYRVSGANDACNVSNGGGSPRYLWKIKLTLLRSVGIMVSISMEIFDKLNVASTVNQSMMEVTRLKEHLAGVDGNVQACPNVPQEVKKFVRATYCWKEK